MHLHLRYIAHRRLIILISQTDKEHFYVVIHTREYSLHICPNVPFQRKCR